MRKQLERVETFEMRASEYLSWFEELLVKYSSIKTFPVIHTTGNINYLEQQDAQAWLSEAYSALAAVFHPNHPIRLDWDRLAPHSYQDLRRGIPKRPGLSQMLGIITAATHLLRDGRIGSILDAVRVETEDELLDQASVLLGAGYLVAAAVIAGGALETHLRHLVTKNGLTISGDGSISKYDAAIAKARNDGTAQVYVQTDSKQVTAWGGVRNDAAHHPGAFKHSLDDVRRMIEGVRGFISRTS